MKGKSVFAIVVVFAIGLTALVVFALYGQNNSSFNGTLIDPPIKAFDFSLPDSQGTIFRLGEQVDHVVLLFFGYTHCPDVCPTTLAEYKVIYNDLGDKADQVRFVYITVDPERDTPEIVAKYAQAFNPDFIGLSGQEKDLIPIYNSYGVFREKQDVQTADDYLMGHTSIIYLIDKHGDWRLTFPFEMGPLEMVEDVLLLLDEK